MESARHSVQLVELCTANNLLAQLSLTISLKIVQTQTLIIMKLLITQNCFDKHFLEAESNLQAGLRLFFYPPPRAPAMCWWDRHSVWCFRCTKSAEGKPVDGAQGCEAKFWRFREEENVWLSPANVNFCLYVCRCSAGKSPSFWLCTHVKYLKGLRDGALGKLSCELMLPGEITALLWREKFQCGGKLKEKSKLHPKASVFHFPLSFLRAGLP